MTVRAVPKRRRPAFTLVELLCTIAIIGVLVALLLPAVQAAREAARRMSCSNNLKQIGLALLNYEGAQRMFPVGARDQFAGTATFGMSWWVAIMPYLEQSALYQSLDQSGAYNGWPLMHPGNAMAVNSVLIPSLTCPSSVLEPLYPVGSAMVLMPSYVGLAGAANDAQFPEPRVSTCCLPVLNGQISAGGVLVPNAHVRGEQIIDGRSNCLVVGECSDYAIDATGYVHRIDGGFPNGWLTGTSVAGTPPQYAAGIPSPSWNITTIRYAPNMRDYTQPGIRDDRGANNPLLSSHSGGVEGLILDGSVRLLSTDMDVISLKRLATRDDGGVP
jgi:prepilin-type N-terminal cleavage/methylation domain-containing protein